MKIVIRSTNWIGDAVMTIPAMRELRRLFPAAEIFLHTRSWALGIFQDADFIDRFITFEPEKSSLSNIRKQARIWRREDFDLAVLLTNSFQTALLAKLGGAKKSFGYKNEGRAFLLTNPVKKPVWKNERHEVFYYLDLIAEIEKEYFGTQTVGRREPQFELEVSAERRARARSILAENGVDPARKTFAFGVGSTNSLAKRWPAENFARLNDLLQNEFDANIILIGSPDELDVSEEVFAGASSKPVILNGRTTLDEAVAVLAEVDLLVSNDMGPAHISAAVGTKTLTIFGPTNPLTTKPWNAEIIRREDVECAPCMLRECPIDHRCLRWITAEDVAERVKSLIGAK
jgi:heptosyltransferase II